MPTVICPNNYCIHNDGFDGICKYDGCIYAEEDCARFESYRDQPDYQDKYWIRCETHEKQFRRMQRGKRIEVKGLTLYTQERLPPQDIWDDPGAGILCTEKETGLGLSLHHVFIPEAYEHILKHKREFQNVMELPEEETSHEEADD